MSSESPKTFTIKNYGCQMNVYDGDRMAELLSAQGMSAAADKANADLVVLNTCHIREKAAEKVYSEIGRLRRRDGSSPMIAVAGCAAQAEGSVDAGISHVKFQQQHAFTRQCQRDGQIQTHKTLAFSGNR